MINVLITGASGRIGSELIRLLLTQEDYRITVLIRTILPSLPKCVKQVDYSKMVESQFENFDYVFFCHGTNAGDFETQVEVNSLLIDRVFSSMPALKYARAVYISTRLVYAGHPTDLIDVGSKLNPLSPYAISKYLGEEVVKILFKDYIIIRTPSVYSEKSILNYYKYNESSLGLIGVFLNQIKCDGEVRLFNDANYVRGYVGDSSLVKIILNAAVNSKFVGVVNSPVERNLDTVSVARSLADWYNVRVNYVGNMSLEARTFETGNMLWGYSSYEERIHDYSCVKGPLSNLM